MLQKVTVGLSFRQQSFQPLRQVTQKITFHKFNEDPFIHFLEAVVRNRRRTDHWLRCKRKDPSLCLILFLWFVIFFHGLGVYDFIFMWCVTLLSRDEWMCTRHSKVYDWCLYCSRKKFFRSKMETISVVYWTLKAYSNKVKIANQLSFTFSV